MDQSLKALCAQCWFKKITTTTNILQLKRTDNTTQAEVETASRTSHLWFIKIKTKVRRRSDDLFVPLCRCGGNFKAANGHLPLQQTQILSAIHLSSSF